MFAREMEAEKSEDIHSLWITTWLENVQIEEQPDYMPFHLYFYLLDMSDWSPEFLRASAALMALAQLMYMFLT